MITTVLTVCDRLDYLESQIEAIENQTVKSEIFIHWNSLEPYPLHYPAFVYKNTEKHFSLYNRFYATINNRTEYTFIPDDDIIPGKNYIEKCIEFSKSKNDKVAIGVLGMNFAEGETKYNVKERVGVGHKIFPSRSYKVDMIGQGYFMHRDILRNYTNTNPLHPYGEDIHLAYCLYNNDIPLYVLDIDKEDKSTYPDLTYGRRGNDAKSQWKHPRHQKLRDFLMESYTSSGWKFKKDYTLL